MFQAVTRYAAWVVVSPAMVYSVEHKAAGRALPNSAVAVGGFAVVTAERATTPT